MATRKQHPKPQASSPARAFSRATHSAVRASVDAHGTEEVRALYAHFDEYNRKHFAGKLAKPLILVTQSKSARNLGDYMPRDAHGLESRIRIAPNVVAWSMLAALDTLLHEMVHAWAHEVAGDVEPGYRGHGPRFAEKCNEIGESIGVERVGVKKRDGLPDCAQWPPRPDGYYPPKPTRKKKAKPAPAPTSTSGEGEGDGGEDDGGDGERAEQGNAYESQRMQAGHMLAEAVRLLEAKKPKSARKKLDAIALLLSTRPETRRTREAKARPAPSTRTAPLPSKCPTCGASGNARCVDVTNPGKPMKRSHASRRTALLALPGGAL